MPTAAQIVGQVAGEFSKESPLRTYSSAETTVTIGCVFQSRYVAMTILHSTHNSSQLLCPRGRVMGCCDKTCPWWCVCSFQSVIFVDIAYPWPTVTECLAIVSISFIIKYHSNMHLANIMLMDESVTQKLFRHMPMYCVVFWFVFGIFECRTVTKSKHNKADLKSNAW